MPSTVIRTPKWRLLNASARSCKKAVTLPWPVLQVTTW